MPSKKTKTSVLKEEAKVHCINCLYFKQVYIDKETKEEYPRCQHPKNIRIKHSWLQIDVDDWGEKASDINKDNNCKSFKDGRIDLAT